jgi:catechol 2,3-dioxygenase-like lactoylglutathione lyase family enzyme
MLMVFFSLLALFVSSAESFMWRCGANVAFSEELSQKRRNFMISGAHMIVYSKDAEADRAFFRDVLGFESVDAGHGWLIFAMPPAEAAFHPSDANDVHELYFMCEDLNVEMAALAEKGVRCSDVQEARWGLITKIQLPGGGKVGLYQPKHPTAIGINL